MNPEQHSSARWNIRYNLFFRLTVQHRTEARKHGTAIGYDTTKFGSDHTVIQSFYESSLSAIIFGGLTAESLIYDLTVRYLGETYTRAHLDKMDLLSKWVVVPRILWGAEIDRGGNVYMRLKDLVKARNDTAHSKSLKLQLGLSEQEGSLWFIEEIQQRDREYHDASENAVRALIDACSWLHAISKDDMLESTLQRWKKEEKNS